MLRHKRTNTVRFPLHDVPGLVKFTETETRTVVARGWGRRNGSCGLIGTEFQSGKMGKFWRWRVVKVAQHMGWTSCH